ncbi:2OG-Fe dioxygenase family protein [Sphingobium sp. OAS761]|uniref:2OG-Fe dioxygenase family protein n=1 Tax=Sphingobium sp. OAS761 TaxID=2817901 RepID=UPI00209FE8B8|nr:2OG-Fe dioxygenase family protein [Sphingobium sp. OAS761]
MTEAAARDTLRRALAEIGFARLPAAECFALLDVEADDWRQFADSWNNLGPDLYMADGGRYRRRRHATLFSEYGRIVRQSHQPHFQSRDYNPLNGDVQRWFDPVASATVENPVMPAVFRLCLHAFDPSGAGRWHIEMHQFRIEAQEGSSGRPTPEGMHRDGVDHVFVMLIDRHNVREGVTRIGTADGTPLGEFTLADPGDAMMVDDHRIFHGVTEIHAIDPRQPAWRDALVVTFATT